MNDLLVFKMRRAKRGARTVRRFKNPYPHPSLISFFLPLLPLLPLLNFIINIIEEPGDAGRGMGGRCGKGKGGGGSQEFGDVCTHEKTRSEATHPAYCPPCIYLLLFRCVQFPLPTPPHLIACFFFVPRSQTRRHPPTRTHFFKKPSGTLGGFHSTQKKKKKKN
ncbi:hypothetical protein DFJ73DRAFT_841737, partial [Zopfochytrium polystomum]